MKDLEKIKISDGDIEKIDDDNMELPLLASRGVVVFPHMVIPLLVGRDRSIEALEEAMLEEKRILIAAQKDESIEDPVEDDLYKVGTITEVKQLVKLPNGMIKVIVEGIQRAKIVDFLETDELFKVKVDVFNEDKTETEELDYEIEALMRSVIDYFKEYVKYNRNFPAETMVSVINIEEPGRLADIIASNLELKYKMEQQLLEAFSNKERLELLMKIIKKEIEILKIENDINEKVKSQVEKTQKEYFLKEKLKVIKDELDEGDADEIEDYKEQLQEIKLTDEVKEKVDKEIKKLNKTPSMSPESTVIRNYLDCILDLPWDKEKSTEINLQEAEKILEKDHYGLEDVKERILEYLAVRKISKKKKSPILCLVGAPGVGKTSLGRSVARALERDFVRMSLGGVRDEAEIRGHRRTYIGSRPGRIINSMRDAGSKNPVFLLDEVDKMSADFRGDPASALLEVLDPEQNNQLTEHYLERPFDLSVVLFITTANVTTTIPAPLLDRMEVIELPGYTEDEKVKISERHLIPRILQEHGLGEAQINISNNALYKIIRNYTREAGVRNLEREISAIVRKISKEIVEGREKKARITKRNVDKYLGVRKFKYEVAKKEDRVGVATGLAYNQAGGDILDIEVAVVPGKGEVILTGSLGDVMQESAKAALSYIRSKHEDLKLDKDFYENYDIHIHVPQGAVPKDGPSAGITMH